MAAMRLIDVMAAMRLIDASNEELLARTPDEPEAFGVFYDRFERQVLAFVSRATGQSEVAADLTAEVFAAALVGASGFRPELGSAQGWLFGIARHQLARAWERGRVEDRARRRLGTSRWRWETSCWSGLTSWAEASRRWGCWLICPRISDWRCRGEWWRSASTASWRAVCGALRASCASASAGACGRFDER